MKTLIQNNIHLAKFVEIIFIKKHPETFNEYAVVLLNIYGNLIPVNVPENLIPVFEILDTNNELLVFIKKTISNEYFLYGIQILDDIVYN